MKIELTLKRKGGSEIDMGDGTTYHFKPEDGRHESPHVAAVANTAHVKRLLGIPGYEVFDGDAPAEPVKPQVKPVAPVGGQTNAPSILDAGSDQTRPAPGADMPLEHMTETDLRATYEAELGKKPHHKAGLEKIIADIEAHRANQE